jgi:hypothetical protein
VRSSDARSSPARSQSKYRSMRSLTRSSFTNRLPVRLPLFARRILGLRFAPGRGQHGRWRPSSRSHRPPAGASSSGRTAA